MSFVKRDYLADFRLQTLLVFLILNDTAKTKLTILEFLYCGEIVKNSILRAVEAQTKLTMLEFLYCGEIVKNVRAVEPENSFGVCWLRDPSNRASG